MSTAIQKLYKVWEANESVARLKTSLPNVQFDEILSSIFTIGHSYHFVIDFFDMSLSNISESIQTIHGLDPSKLVFNDILDLIHPDDMDFVAKAEAKVLETFNHEIGRDKYTRYKTGYCFRCKTAENDYKLFHHQSIILTTDINGEFIKSLNVHTDISHITTENNYNISFIGVDGEPSFMNLSVDDTLPHDVLKSKVFSKREEEIIKLIAEGMTSENIAKHLNIAFDTAKNHRRNIMMKAGVKGTAKLIKKCIMEGWV